MLVSLCAGGVGLNLIGGNHLFLMDMHWYDAHLQTQARVPVDHNIHKALIDNQVCSLIVVGVYSDIHL